MVAPFTPLLGQLLFFTGLLVYPFARLQDVAFGVLKVEVEVMPSTLDARTCYKNAD